VFPSFRTYGEPEGSPADEVGVMDDVVLEQHGIAITPDRSPTLEVEHEPTAGKGWRESLATAFANLSLRHLGSKAPLRLLKT
jgi:hypothetical protein